MTRFVSHSLALMAAVLITLLTMQQVTTVPLTQTAVAMPTLA